MKSFTFFRLSALTAISSVLLLPAHGQNPEELLRFSRQNFGISSARSAAMGGAFTSLGADAATLSLNPAGIAMYRQGEVSVSPSLRLSSAQTDYSGSKGSVRNNESYTRFNIGSAAAIYAGKNFAVGFGVNRLGDFTGYSRAKGYDEKFSIGDMFAEQLYGLSTQSISSPEKDPYQAFFNYPNRPDLWGAILGYQTGMVDPIDGTNPQQYTTRGILSPGAQLLPGWEQRTKGGINEYAFTAGYSFNDVLYIGATLGIQDIYYKRQDIYTEAAPIDNIGLDNMSYRQDLVMDGTGVNIKLGATVRPLPWLRLAMAYHSPTWIATAEDSFSDMTVYSFKTPGRYYYADTPIYRQEYNTRTPSRLQAGLSATIGSIGIISVDYERVWYNYMKYKSGGFSDLNDMIQESYAPVNNVRAGIEIQAAPSFFLRAGYNYNSSPYKASALNRYGEIQQYSGGLGYRTKQFSIDLAYVYSSQRQFPFKPFDYTASDGYHVVTDGTIYTDQKFHNVILSLAVRF